MIVDDIFFFSATEQKQDLCNYMKEHFESEGENEMRRRVTSQISPLQVLYSIKSNYT